MYAINADVAELVVGQSMLDALDRAGVLRVERLANGHFKVSGSGAHTAELRRAQLEQLVYELRDLAAR